MTKQYMTEVSVTYWKLKETGWSKLRTRRIRILLDTFLKHIEAIESNPNNLIFARHYDGISYRVTTESPNDRHVYRTSIYYQ
jgi:hypothetical protein